MCDSSASVRKNRIGFFHGPFDNVPAAPLLVAHAKQTYDTKNVIIVSPDHGGMTRVRRFARMLDDNAVGLFDKRRSKDTANKIEHMQYVGPDVFGKDVIIHDDMLDTGGTALGAVTELYALGAKSVALYVTHGLLSGADASVENKLHASNAKLVITNTIPRTDNYRREHAEWLTVLPIAPALARVVREAATEGGSISALHAN